MKIVSAFALTTLVLSTATTTKTSVNAQAVGDGPAENELPITTTDVFIQSGEIKPDSAVVMARCNTEIDSYVTLNVGDQTYEGQAYAARDYTISIQVTDLTPQTVYTYTVECASMQDPTQTVTSSEGTLKTLPTEDDDEFDFSFIWVSCLSGQGWGRNPDFELTTFDGKMVKGGYIVFDTMLDLAPDFAIFQGDMVYGDNPIPPVKEIPEELGGGNWTNNPSKNFLAITLDDFRANWKYNHGDEKMQTFLAQTPIYVQWDDHEVTNNWYPGEVFVGENNNGEYADGSAVDSLYAESLQAFYEFNPIMRNEKIYRSQRFGKHVEIFFPDYRSYRDPNPNNSDPGPVTILGEEQLAWLMDGLKSSTATWKIISSHDPFGIVTGGPGDYDAFGNEDPLILGREFEFQSILQTIQENNIVNVVSLTSDVHFTAHVEMDPSRAEGGFTDFKTMHEFAIGPIHAGAFGPNFLDASFGPEYLYELGPLTLGYERWANLPPTEIRLQSFGRASVSGSDGSITIQLIAIDGTINYEITLEPEEAAPVDTPAGSPTDDGSCQTISELVCSDDSLSILCEFATLAGLDSTLEGGTWTVFAPTNSAFESSGVSLPVGEVEDLIAFHATSGNALMKSDLVCKEVISMANGKSSRTKCDNNDEPTTYYQVGADNAQAGADNPMIIEFDITACNGVIHKLDGVMLPSGFFPEVEINSGY